MSVNKKLDKFSDQFDTINKKSRKHFLKVSGGMDVLGPMQILIFFNLPELMTSTGC